LAFEEVVSNIISYGYTDDREHRIHVSVDRFNPLEPRPQ
jgi:two-component sensor histidine kinase